MTLANKITVGRIVMVPMIVIGLLEGYRATVYTLLAICMATDFLDGLVARRRGEHTKLGAFLDPMADKLLLTSLFMTLAFLHQVPMWIFVVVFSRDLLIVLGWLVIYILTGSNKVEPRPLGKATTALQMTTALSVLLELPILLTKTLLIATIVLTIASAVEYIMIGEKKLGAWN